MSWLLKKKGPDVLDTLDSVVDAHKVELFARIVVEAGRGVRAGWSIFTEEEKKILLAYAQRVGMKLITKVGTAMATGQDGDSLFTEVMDTLQAGKSKTVASFLEMITNSIKGVK
jgi:hypothetical protein